jgi:hypothetical protein
MSFSPKKTGPISPKVSALADALRAGTLDSDRESGVISRTVLEDPEAANRLVARRALTTRKSISPTLSVFGPDEMRRVTSSFLLGALSAQ